jgi:outer membrane biosynthesis protein TonB
MPLIMAYPGLEVVEPGGARTNTTPVIDQDLTPEARAAINLPKFAQGTIVVKVRIRPDGHVEDAVFVSGAIPMQKPSIEAARQWVFRPFIVTGEARPVETELSFTVNENAF